MSPVYLYAQQEASLILIVQHASTLCMNYSTEVCHLLFSKYTMQCTYITSDSPQGKKLFSWQQGRGAEARKNKVEKLQTNHQKFRRHIAPSYVVSASAVSTYAVFGLCMCQWGNSLLIYQYSPTNMIFGYITRFFQGTKIHAMRGLGVLAWLLGHIN